MNKDNTETTSSFSYCTWFRDKKLVGEVRKTLLPQGIELLVNKKDTSYKLLKLYWDNGTIQVKSYIRNGLKHGPIEEYFLDGTLISEGMFANGKKNGTFHTFHSNQKIYAISHYNYDKPIGNWLYYDTAGTLIKTIIY